MRIEVKLQSIVVFQRKVFGDIRIAATSSTEAVAGAIAEADAEAVADEESDT